VVSDVASSRVLLSLALSNGHATKGLHDILLYLLTISSVWSSVDLSATLVRCQNVDGCSLPSWGWRPTPVRAGRPQS
jgi:hypothetical protein